MSNQIENWHSQETYKSLIQYGVLALKFVLLVNGGAIISLLTFVGNMQSETSLTTGMKWPFIWFLLGMLAGGLATITTYLTQLSLFREGQGDIAMKIYYSHVFWLYWSLFLIIVGIVFFAIGSLVSIQTIA